MEEKNIMIILLVIIIVLAASLGVMFLQTSNAKEPSKIKITNNNTLYEEDSLSIKLTDLNKTPISKENVNIVITNKENKVVVNETVKTDSKGIAKLDLDLKKGTYTVNVVYNGNENYTGNNTTQKLTINEPITESTGSQEYKSTDSQEHSYSDRGDDYLASNAERTGVSYSRDKNGHVSVNEYEYAEYASRTGDTW